MFSEVSRLLELLAERSLLSERKLAKLRHQLDEKEAQGKSVPLDSLAKLLVHKGHLTQRQANSLVNEIVEERQYQGEDEDDLVLRPIEGEEPDKEGHGAGDVPSAHETSFAESGFVEEDPDLSELEEAAASKPVKKRRDWGSRESSGEASADRPRSGALDSPMDELAAAADVPSSTPRGVRHPKKGSERSEWESPLLLLGGGGLLLLVLVGTLVWYLLRTDTGDAHLRAAREAYADGAYAQAIESYEQFVEGHADHDEVSSARVHLALARLRRSLESGASPEILLEQAQKEIARVEGEAAFNEAGRELAAILPGIAEGLSEQARQADTSEAAEEYSAKTEEALALLTNTKYVPKSFRPTGAIEDVRRTLASVERREARKVALSTALAAMQRAREESQFQQAYQTYGALIREYADLSELPEVRAAVASIADAEASSLRFQETSKPASTEERDQATTETVLLSTPLQTASSSDTGGAATAFVRVEGAVYGVDAESGDLLWRRYVGYADLLPLPTGDGEVLALDADHGELLRLQGRTGELVWRQPVGEVVGNGVVHGDNVYLPTADARLLSIGLETGEVQGFLQFAQPIATTPTVHAESERIVVVGEQSILYVLSVDKLRSEDAVFVGHAAGSVRVPAIVVGDVIGVAENFAVSRSRLHVFSSSSGDSGQGEGPEFQSEIEPIRLTGRVTTPMEVSGRRLAVVTDRGEVRIFEVSTVADGPPLSPIASRDASTDASSGHYLELHDSELWVAGTRLMRLQILSTASRLQAGSLPQPYAGDAFVHPLLRLGDRLIHIRRPRGEAGNLIAAISIRTGEPLWERELAAPATDLSVLPGDSEIVVATASGRLYRFTAPQARGDGAGNRLLTSRHEVAGGIEAIAVASNQLVVMASRSDNKLHVMDVQQATSTLRELKVPSRVSAAPTVFADGILVPLQVGQVLWIDPSSGEALASPFQPPIRLPNVPQWSSAATVEPGRSFAIADRGGRVYLVEVLREEQPARLEMVAQSPPTAGPLTGGLCATPSVILAAAGNRLLRLRLPDLSEDSAVKLDAPIVWGPYGGGDAACFATADLRLHCVDQEGRVVTTGSISASPTGRPLSVEQNRLLVALADGNIMKVDVEEGITETYSSFGQPLASGPVPVGGGLGAVTTDGMLVMQP